MGISLNNSNHGYFRIKGSMLEFVGNSCQEQTCGGRKCTVHYTTASSTRRRAKAWYTGDCCNMGICCLCVPQLQPQLEDDKYNRAAREALK